MLNKEYTGAISLCCTGCETWLYLQVCNDEAGYYTGFYCPNCGPYSRESEYVKSLQEANLILNDFEQCDYEEMRYAEEVDRKYKEVG